MIERREFETFSIKVAPAEYLVYVYIYHVKTDFDYKKILEKLLTPEIVQMVGSIHEHKGKQELFLEANIDELKTLLEVALISGISNSRGYGRIV